MIDSTQPKAVTLAAFHTPRRTACIDCHSGGGIFGRAEGLQQGAHDLAQFLSGTYHRPAITTNPLGDDSCVKCHANTIARAQRGGSRGMNGHFHFYLPQWQAVDTQAAHCTSCHPAHTRGLESLQFMAQGQVARLCEECHTALSGRVR
jgi:predicted CXXCH cytochrome family protein